MQVVSIYEPVQEGLDSVKEKLRRLVDPSPPDMAELLDHVMETTGKRVRPAITLLASMFHPHDERVIEIMATAIELLHIATLVHDDTVDNADMRRGKATVSRQWGRNAAVLLGDYIFATSATFVCDTGNIRVIRRFAETIMELSSGELTEMAEAYTSDQSRERYFQRIYNKTASLFTTAGESGAILSGAPEGSVQGLREYGYNLGMAFQIVDDILDFDGTREEVGKPVGSDLAHGILTLPAIMAIERYPENNVVSESFRNPDDRDSLRRAVDLIQSSTVVDDSFAVAKQYGQRALACLEGLERNPSRDSLGELVHYVLNRRS